MIINLKVKDNLPIYNLYVVVNFDRTITNGSSPILANSNLVSKTYVLYGFYRSIEVIDYSCKLRLMKECFQKHF